MRHVALGLSLTLTIAGAAMAGQPASVESEPTAKEARVLYVCDRSAETRRSFEREYGAIRYMTADEVLRAKADGREWSAPRCITETEHRRLVSLEQAAARMQQASIAR